VRVDRETALAEVAYLYYKERRDQNDIAARLGVSRSTVSRMLRAAERQGIVEIRIRGGLPHAMDLQRKLGAALDLRDAMVLDTHGYSENVVRRVGRLGAHYLDACLAEDDILAVSWGSGVRSVVDAFTPRPRPKVEVVQLLGGTGALDVDLDGVGLAHRLGGLLAARVSALNAPLVVDREELARELREDRSIRRTLEIAAQADVALVGVGSTRPAVSAMLRAGYTDESELAQLRALGAVGDVCGHHFGLGGELVDVELNRRIIAIDVEALRSIPRVIGVATGADKAEAILGAARARLVDVVVTDDVTARAVLVLL
jgi:DNA-binding transcriptional regulator LsrR (DeoR family)